MSAITVRKIAKNPAFYKYFIPDRQVGELIYVML